VQSDRRPVAAVVYPVSGLAVAALGVIQLLLTQPRPPDLSLSIGAVLLAGVAVAFLRVVPLPALLVVLAVDAGHQVLVGIPPFAAFLATIVAVFELTRAAGRWALLVGYAATLITVGVLLPYDDEPVKVLIPLAFFAVAAGIGALVRHIGAYWQVSDEKDDALDREREHRAGLAAAAERGRLARELHDVVSHGVSLMVLQAEAAQQILASRPDQAAAALDMVGMTGRRAMADLRNLLGVLQSPTPDEPLVDLATVVEPVRQTGLEVKLVETGEADGSPDEVRLVANRVVQEALTNVLKHANATAVTVTVRHDPGRLDVEVTDDGAGGHGLGSSTGPGEGLADLRERVTALGGTLDAGPVERGFRVHAALPWPVDATTSRK
jgi:signal transduction histidine kinase